MARTCKNVEDLDAARELEPPAPWLTLLEGRAVAELASGVISAPLLLRSLPRGDGHPVMVLPGFLAGDVSTAPLRAVLRALGYPTRPWGFGRNFGPSSNLEPKLAARVAYLSRVYDRKLSLIGWSLGGIYAREIARVVPEAVRSVITLGSPFGHAKANRVWGLFQAFSGVSVDRLERDRRATMRTPPPVPSTAIYSRTDGVAHWRSCVQDAGPEAENIEVESSHCGLGWNPLVVAAIADRLAQPEGDWRPFEREGWRRALYPTPTRTAEPAGV